MTCNEKKHLGLDFFKMMNDGGVDYLQAEISDTINLAKCKDKVDILGEYAEAIEGNSFPFSSIIVYIIFTPV
jgi:hypothetical protein